MSCTVYTYLPCYYRGQANNYKFKTISKYVVLSLIIPVVIFDYFLN